MSVILVENLQKECNSSLPNVFIGSVSYLLLIVSSLSTDFNRPFLCSVEPHTRLVYASPSMNNEIWYFHRVRARVDTGF